MLDYQLGVDQPATLWLLFVLLPAVVWLGLRGRAGLGTPRWLVVLVLRGAVVTLIVLALAETQLVRTSDRMTVTYLLDVSLSIPASQRARMMDFVNASVGAHRQNDDRVAVVVFGRDAAVEVPPLDFDIELTSRVESRVDRQYTNLAEAFQLALALFPHDTAKRVVVVSDGNENVGAAMTQARALTEKGISIDVLPVMLRARSDVALQRITLPPDVRRGQPFDLRVVVTRSSEADDEEPARGTLRIIRKTGQREEILADNAVELSPGKRVFSIREQIDRPDFYTYEARFLPDDPASDAVPQNNRASTFTHVRGRGQVLLIEDWSRKGQFDYLVERLRDEGLEVTVQSSDRLFSSLAELQRYDTVILADVPRSSGEDAQTIMHFSDEQVRMLVHNTHELGSGLIMLGGPHSFGAGGWTNSDLEQAMPVDFQVKNPEVVPVGALALLMHASEMARGNYWQKLVAREAIKALGPQDYCGLIHWSGIDSWLWGQVDGGLIRVGPKRKHMLAMLDQMTPGDMPQFEPAMKMAAAGFASLQGAAVKHMIIISDGDPSPPDYGPLGSIRALKQQGVKVTTVAVGTHGPPGSTPLQRIATNTGGKYYVVNNPQALPRIYQREVRRIARPLIYEDDQGMVPEIRFPHEMLKGVPPAIRPITGYVLTTVKESPLVEVALTAPRPAGGNNNALLASWTYGLGKAVAWTTDTGQRWAADWPEWEHYDKLFSQMVRWSMRPSQQQGDFTISTDVEDGQARIVVTALDAEGEYLNLLNLTGRVVMPDMSSRAVAFQQISPGRYIGQFEAKAAGSYSVVIQPGPDRSPLLTGVDVPYSAEFRDRESNLALLTTMASLAPDGGGPGAVIPAATSDDPGAWLKVNPFRRDTPPATASRDVWPLLVMLAACILFCDVLVRRVHLSLAWLFAYLGRLRDRLLGRDAVAQPVATMDRLRRRKAQLGEDIQKRQASARFETGTPPAESPYGTEHAEPFEPVESTPPTSGDEDEPSYTERLLKAKQKLWQDRKDQ